jgi:gluconate 5-dehydrogenase
MPGSEFDLSGRRVLLTGGAGELGFAMATALARAGAAVILTGRDRSKLDKAVEALTGEGHTVEARTCDLLQPEQVRELVEDVKTSGPIDVLINNAGVQKRGPLSGVSLTDWERMIGTHLTAPFLLTRDVSAAMIKRKSGKIINTLSIASELGRGSIVPYTAAKGGLKMLTRGLAAELGPSNIQVNGVAPGYFRTEMNRPLFEDPKFDAWVRTRTPLGRWAEPSELGGAVVFLASNASNFMTGQVIYIDGGLTASV